MTDNNNSEEAMTDVPHEGENPFKSESENENSEDSSTEENEAENTQSDEGDDTHSEEETGTEAGDKDVPFHLQPRWKEREAEWDKRFNDQESRHQDSIKEIREEFATARKDNASTEIPTWFGGEKEQWDAYQKHQESLITQAEERAVNRLTKTQTDEKKAIDDATTYMQDEMASIEIDKTLNPDGKKVDPNKLLKFVMDNDLVDSKGRWNYKAGWKLIQGTSSTSKATEKKKIAGATTSESKGEDKPTAFKTSEDFKQVKPW